ncbi:MAG: hypothetical protein AB1516_08040 [Pseudomonadota bacterium]
MTSHFLNVPELVSSWHKLHRSFGFQSAAKGWFFSIATETEFLLNRDEWLLSHKVIEQNSVAKSLVVDAVKCIQAKNVPEIGGEYDPEQNQGGVLIIGCGPVGMWLAVSLKRRFGDHLPVVLLEHRTQFDTDQIRFSRAWPINIPASIMAGITDELLPATSYLPWNLNDLEMKLFPFAPSSRTMS